VAPAISAASAHPGIRRGDDLPARARSEHVGDEHMVKRSLLAILVLVICAGRSESFGFAPWATQSSTCDSAVLPSARAQRDHASIRMIEGPLQSALRFLWPYPKFKTTLPGPHACVSSLVRTRLDEKTCVATISYPAQETSIPAHREPYWSPEAVDGLADYIGASGTSKALLSPLRRQWHPSPVGLLPAECSGGGATRWPLIIFSHGLAGCADMYTDLCRSLASFGYIVVALEHEDGSGVHATSISDGRFIRYKRPDSSPYSREKVTTFRAGFLQHRVSEISSFLRALHAAAAADGEERGSGAGGAGGAGEQVLAVLRAADVGQIALVGHSFGAAGVYAAAQELSAEYHFGLAALLDPWAYSLPDAMLRDTPPVPLVSVLSEEWTRNKEVFAVDSLLDSAHTAARLEGSYSVKGSVHQSFSDTQCWLPGALGARLGMKDRTEERGSMHALVAATIHVHICGAAGGGNERGPRQRAGRLPRALLDYRHSGRMRETPAVHTCCDIGVAN
jgi:platelet-activating factor acetylhydrolase